MSCPLCENTVVPLTDEEPITPADADTTDSAVAEMNRSADMRRDENEAETRLQGKIQTSDFDVFLCYHSRDRSQVTAIGKRLKEIGILPWLDVWEIPPGKQWQLLEARAMHAWETKAATVESFIFAAVASERED